MNQLRASLTRLKNKIREKLPDGPDVFGYPGVTRDELVTYTDESHSLIGRLEALRGSFAIVALKRKVEPWLEDCNHFLDHKVSGKEVSDDFDKFLRSLTKIHDEIYLTHVIYNSESLRTEAEVEAAISNLEATKAAFNEAKPELDQAIASLTTIANAQTEAVATSAKMEESLVHAMTAHEKITIALTEATANAQTITKHEVESLQQKNKIVQLATDGEAAEKKLKRLLKEGTEGSTAISNIVTEGKSMMEINAVHQEEIGQTIRMASKYGMAASFKQRKDELRWSLYLWGGVFVVAMAGIFTTGLKYVLPAAGAGTVSPHDIAVKISLIAPLVWLGWMAAKQYGYISRIREDYSFKYASALAYEGYKKEASEVNRDMLSDLLNVATDNMALNPLRIYGDDSNHASPFHEVFSKAADRIDAKGLSKDLADTLSGILKTKLEKPNVD